jgi:hypothetical protein
MWAALEAHKPEPAYAEAWRVMCKERTEEAARAAWDAAPEGSAAKEAAWAAAWWVPKAARADLYAQHAIDALKREVKP